MKYNLDHTPVPWVAEEVDLQETNINFPNGESRLQYYEWEKAIVVYGCDADTVIGNKIMRANVNIILNSDPMLKALLDIYRLKSKDIDQVWLEKIIVNAAGKSLEEIMPSWMRKSYGKRKSK